MDKNSNSIYDAYLCFDISCVTAVVDSFSVECCPFDNCNLASKVGDVSSSSWGKKVLSNRLYYTQLLFFIFIISLS